MGRSVVVSPRMATVTGRTSLWPSRDIERIEVFRGAVNTSPTSASRSLMGVIQYHFHPA